GIGTPLQTGITGTSFADSGLSPGTTYRYQVSAVNSVGEGPRSAEAAATTPNGVGVLGGSSDAALTGDLPQTGSLDWMHWGRTGATSVDRKAGASILSTFTRIGTGQVLAYNNDLRRLSWSNGSPMTTSSGSTAGLYTVGVGNGFALEAPADT